MTQKALVLVLVAVVVVVIVAAAGLVLLNGGNENEEKETGPETPIVSSYIVTFHANGGTGEGSQRLVKAGDSILLPSNNFLRLGYYYESWCTTPDGTGDIYSPGEYFTPTSNQTICAIWVDEPTLTINYQSNDGNFGFISDHPTLTKFSNLRSASTFTWEGHTFDSWNTEEDGSGTKYDAGSSPDPAELGKATVTLYAQWI
ncbi:MAG: InlB B-repeat-containing protein [Candidatus Methanoplasma sp.]|jgi:hypothetical protein|nr:InlB B-repeat-containing protein [Candidatus Methanoplasma sp.]